VDIYQDVPTCTFSQEGKYAAWTSEQVKCFLAGKKMNLIFKDKEVVHFSWSWSSGVEYSAASGSYTESCL
jgi:hypothetical protein